MTTAYQHARVWRAAANKLQQRYLASADDPQSWMVGIKAAIAQTQAVAEGYEALAQELEKEA